MHRLLANSVCSSLLVSVTLVTVVAPGSLSFTVVPLQQRRRFASNDRVVTMHAKAAEESIIPLDRNPVTTSGGASNTGKKPLLASAGLMMAACIAAAVTGLTPGYVEGQEVLYNLIARDLGATVLTGLLGLAFVQLNTWAVAVGRLDSKDTRKIVHTFSAPLFMLLWPLFTPHARFFAAIVPTLNTLRLFLARRVNTDEDLVAALSRSGTTKETLEGCTIYVALLAVSTMLFWRDSTIGIVAMSTLAAGDGMADLVGRRLGANNKWPGSDKSIAGSVSFWIASTLCSTGLLVWLQHSNCLVLSMGLSQVAVTIAGISLVSALVEVIPFLGDDNYSVPISAAVLAALFL